MRIGLAASATVMVPNVAYYLATLDRPNRPALFVLQTLAVAVGVLVVVTSRGRAGTWLRARVSAGCVLLFWTASQTLFILVAMALDGGLVSPLSALLLMPLLIGSLTFTPRVVVICAVGNALGIVAVGAVTATLDVGHGAILPTVLAATALVATTAGRSLWELTSELDRANADLLELARADSLTGCLNHRSFHEELTAALTREERRGGSVAVLLIDVDHFKRINDRYGHPMGDEVLIAMANAMSASIRAGDVLGRTGGEEFAVLLPDTDLAAAVEVGERLRDRSARLVDVPERMTVSVGVAVSWGAGTAPAALVHEADRAMYDAKRAGRDRLAVAGEEPVGAA